MENRTKLFAFRFSERTIALLDAICEEYKREKVLTGWPIRITRTGVIKALIDNENANLERRAREKLDAELQARKEKTLVKPKTKKGTTK